MPAKGCQGPASFVTSSRRHQLETLLRQRTLRAARVPAIAENAHRGECSPGHGPGEVAATPARRAFSRAVERFAEQHVSGLESK